MPFVECGIIVLTTRGKVQQVSFDTNKGFGRLKRRMKSICKQWRSGVAANLQTSPEFVQRPTIQYSTFIQPRARNILLIWIGHRNSYSTKHHNPNHSLYILLACSPMQQHYGRSVSFLTFWVPRKIVLIHHTILLNILLRDSLYTDPIFEFEVSSASVPFPLAYPVASFLKAVCNLNYDLVACFR